jgi:hypothetical protein
MEVLFEPGERSFVTPCVPTMERLQIHNLALPQIVAQSHHELNGILPNLRPRETRISPRSFGAVLAPNLERLEVELRGFGLNREKTPLSWDGRWHRPGRRKLVRRSLG